MKKLSDETGITIIEVSAKKGTQVEDAFITLTRQLIMFKLFYSEAHKK